MLKNKKHIAYPMFGIAIAAFLFGATTIMASTPGFRSSLPRWQGHTTVVAGRKDSSSSSNAYLKLDDGSKNGWFWVDRSGHGQATDRYFLAGNNERTLPYYSSGWTGDTSLRGHQEWWGPGEDSISGWINFG